MNLNLPEEVECYRDMIWRREPESRVETVLAAERMIDQVGFCATMTDARRPGPSLYIAVCGRRDAHMPRNIQKDPESNLTWRLKDDLMRRGRIYYGKLARGRTFFIAPRLLPFFNSIWGVARRKEAEILSRNARSVLKVLRREWEMATCDLRTASKLESRAALTKALDELQRTMKVLPQEVMYEPWFTYIWTLSDARFVEEFSVKTSREESLREIARAFLGGAGMTIRGELARVTGLSRPDAGIGNRALVTEGYAERLDEGVYRLSDFEARLRNGFGSARTSAEVSDSLP